MIDCQKPNRCILTRAIERNLGLESSEVKFGARRAALVHEWRMSRMKRNLLIGAAFLIAIVALAIAFTVFRERAEVEAAGVMEPMFEVDPMWPKPLPNHWVMGMTIGVSADDQDNI